MLEHLHRYQKALLHALNTLGHVTDLVGPVFFAEFDAIGINTRLKGPC